MKPNDKAIEAAIRYLEAPMSAREQMEQILTAAYAAQFQSEEYAGLIERLKTLACELASVNDAVGEKFVEINEAADALEALLAERDDFAEQLALRSESGMAKDMQEIMRINNELVAERDVLAARLAPVDDNSRHLTTDEQKVFHSALRRSAKIKKPVEDEALVETVAGAINDGSKNIARAAIAAIRPHIEAAERERCAKIAEARLRTAIDLPDVIPQIAAAIRKG